jgi:hypothetical protein
MIAFKNRLKETIYERLKDVCQRILFMRILPLPERPYAAQSFALTGILMIIGVMRLLPLP